MKHAELRSIVHNIADSLASGVSLLVGHYLLDVFGEASRSEGGSMTVDFLNGVVTEGVASAELIKAVAQYPAALGALCSKAGGNVGDLREAKARYWSDHVSRRFTVTIEDRRGRRTTTDYAGVPGKRVKAMDGLGRLRPKPSSGHDDHQ